MLFRDRVSRSTVHAVGVFAAAYETERSATEMPGGEQIDFAAVIGARSTAACSQSHKKAKDAYLLEECKRGAQNSHRRIFSGMYSVGRSVGHDREHCKNGLTDCSAVWRFGLVETQETMY